MNLAFGGQDVCKPHAVAGSGLRLTSIMSGKSGIKCVGLISFRRSDRYLCVGVSGGVFQLGSSQNGGLCHKSTV